MLRKFNEKDLLDLLNYFFDNKKGNYEGIIKSLMKLGWNLNESLGYRSENVMSKACRAVDIQTVSFLISQGVDINERDPFSCQYPINIVVRAGYLDLLNKMIEHGADLERHGIFGDTPLHNACSTADPAMVERLLQFDLDVNAVNTASATPLIVLVSEYFMTKYPSEANLLAVAKLLLAKGADVNIRDSNYCSALYYAADAGYPEFIELLIEHGADVNKSCGDGITPLMVAAKQGHFAIVKNLVEHGANIQARDYSKYNSLHHACINGHMDIAEFFIEKGCDVNSLSADNFTPLHGASKLNFDGLVEFLLKKGASINAQTKLRKETPLLMAIGNGNENIARLLVENGADLNAKNSENVTPFHLAIKKSLDNFALYLLEKGCQFETRDKHVETPFYSLCKRESTPPNYKLALKLLKLGADPNYRCPLLNLCENFNSNNKLISTLIKYGANVQAIDTDGITPLHIAVNYGNAKLVKKLIQLGASVHTKESKSRYPIHYTFIGFRFKSELDSSKRKTLKSCLKILEILKEAGADLNARTDNGVTAFHYIQNNYELRLLEKFADLGANMFITDVKGRDLEFRAKKRGLKHVLTWIKELKAKRDE